MLSINTNSAYTYGCQTAAYRRQNIQKTFAENVNQQLTPPSVIHIGELGFGADNLGRQYALNYAEDSTDENPIVIARGNDEYRLTCPSFSSASMLPNLSNKPS